MLLIHIISSELFNNHDLALNMANIFKNFKTKLGNGTLTENAVAEHFKNGGNNSNGNFIKLPDGTQMITGYYSAEVDGSGKFTVAFPKTFVGTPVIVPVPIYMTNAKTTMLMAGQTNAKFDAYFTIDNATATGVQQLAYVAIGRWK